VVEGGRVVAPPGHGEFLPRGPYELIRPRGVFPGPFNPVDGVPA
jgi:dihydropyrimidinase